MGLEELFWLAVRLVGPSIMRVALQRLVEGAQSGELVQRPGCVPASKPFDADEMGIYSEEDDECRG